MNPDKEVYVVIIGDEAVEEFYTSKEDALESALDVLRDNPLDEAVIMKYAYVSSETFKLDLVKH